MTNNAPTPVTFAASAGYAPRRWRDGERVTRELYMDDGTWMRLGDKCLPRSPLRHGVVTRRDPKRRDGVWVRWDGDTKERHYLDHGIDAEEAHIAALSADPCSEGSCAPATGCPPGQE